MTSRFIAPVFDGGNGVTPADGLQLFFFATGTSTPKDTFSDPAGATPNSNPVISDADGVFPDIFITGTYKVQFKDKNGVAVGFNEADPVSEVLSPGDAANDLRYGPIFTTISAMVAVNPVSADGFAVNIVAGMTIHTQGRITSNDGGGTSYFVVAGDISNGGTKLLLGSGDTAKMVESINNDIFTAGATSDTDKTAVKSLVTHILDTPKFKEISPLKRDFNRPPLLSDFDGIANGQVWQHDEDIWVSSRVFSNTQGSWQRDSDGFRPMVADVSDMLGCWWLHKVIPTYAGACIKVRSEALGTTLDIGFDVNGNLDVEALQGFLVATRGFVHTWFDQSGLGNNLTSLVNANQPLITKEKEILGGYAVLFESDIISNGASNPEQFLEIPVAVATNSNSLTFATIVKCASTIRTTPFITLDGTTSTALGYKDQTAVDAIVGYSNDSVRPLTNYQPSTSPEFFAYSSGSGSLDIYANDTATTSFSAVAAIALAGGKIGSSDSGLFLDGAAQPVNGGHLSAGLTIYNTDLSLLGIREVHRVLARRLNIKPQIRGNLIFEGDSITEGAFATFFNNWPKLVGNQLVDRFRPYNVARSGGTTTSQLTNLANWNDHIFSSTTATNIVVVFVGTNDIGALRTGADTYADLKILIQTIQAVGYDVIVATGLPRDGFTAGQETERLAFNALIVAGWEFDLDAIGLLDFASEKTMGVVANTANVAFYTDGTHPTDLGYALLANFAAEFLGRIL